MGGEEEEEEEEEEEDREFGGEEGTARAEASVGVFEDGAEAVRHPELKSAHQLLPNTKLAC